MRLRAALAFNRRIQLASMGFGDLCLYAACEFLVAATGLTVGVLLHAEVAGALILIMSRRRRRRAQTSVSAAVTACPATILVMLA